MPVIHHQNSQAAEVERVIDQNITALEGPNIQLVMTYRGIAGSCEAGEELMSWIDARCEDLGACPLAFLLGCAELVREME
jgi:hypothetical protein